MVGQDRRDALLRTLYAAPLQPELWDVFLQGLAETVGASKAAVISHDLVADNHRIFATFGDATRDSIALYEKHYYQFDEWTSRFAKRIPIGRFALGEEVWPRELMQESVFFNDFLKPFDTCQMACSAVAARGVLDALSVFRGPREAPIDTEQLGVLQSFVPHLTTALSLRHRLSELDSKEKNLENAFDRLAAALVLLNAKGNATFVNRAAKLLLDANDGLLLKKYGLRSQIASEDARLQTLIARAIAAGSRKCAIAPGSLLVSRKSNGPLHLVVAPLLLEGLHTGGSAIAIVSIGDPESKTHLPSEILREFYGLTAAEVRLASSLLEGNSLGEAAALAGVGRETVRSQIKSIFHKTGTRRQGQLIRFLSRLEIGLR